MTLPCRHNERDGVSNYQPHDCLPNSLFRCRSTKTSKHRVTGLCGGSPVTSEFPAQKASNAENVSIWWRHPYTTRSTMAQVMACGLLRLPELLLNPHYWLCDIHHESNFTASLQVTILYNVFESYTFKTSATSSRGQFVSNGDMWRSAEYNLHCVMMRSLNGNIFRVTGHLRGEFPGLRWIPRTKASDAQLWCFLWSVSK